MSYVFRRPFDYRATRSNLFLLLASASAAVGSSDLSLAATGSLTGAGALAGSASITLSASGTVIGDAPIQGTADLTLGASGSLLGSGALAGVSALVLDASATGSTVQTYNPHVWPKRVRLQRQEVDYNFYTNRLVIFPYNVSADIGGQADIIFTGSGVLFGIGAISGSGGIILTGSGTLRGTGALATSTPITLTGSGTLGGTISGAIAGSSDIVLSSAATLNGIGALTGVGGMQLSASAAPSQILAMLGASSIVLTSTGILSDINTPSSTPISGQTVTIYGPISTTIHA